MTQHDNGQGEGLPARQEAREERDRVKAAFGARLRVLLDLSGLSSREFAHRYPAYKDSTIRKYTLGTNLPPWDFLHDLLTEVARRTDDPAAPQRRTELFTAYRDTLVRIGATPRGSDQNSLLLRLLDGEEALRRIVEELAEVRARETQLRLDLEEEARRTWPTPSPDSEDRKRRIEQESRELARRRDALVERRSALVTELDQCREQLRVFEGGADPHRQIALPPRPLLPPGPTGSNPGFRRRVLALAGGAVAVVLLAGGGVVAGIWYMKDDVQGSGQDARGGEATSASPELVFTASPTLTFSEDPAEEEPASPTPLPIRTPSFVPPSGRTWSLINDLASMEDHYPWDYETGKARINAQDYPRTLRGNDGEATATWQLDRKYASLVTRLGVTDESGTGDSVVFTIEVDDQPARKITMGPGQDPESVTVDLTGAFRMKLSVDNVATGLTLGIGAWIDPVLTK
ncbi:NPCBM/NEW2 domain-containing protein [Streptomyces sp. NPDC085942]|uniref:NPCBM/NEW2 domain-containing protein n=1 Tax=Streptomyces sp. NPDC085942 TaxID=3365743 RepID=UPI0037D4DA48